MPERTLEELFEELKKLPDWNRYPYPEVFYKHFHVDKPTPAGLSELLQYTPPPSEPLKGETIVPDDKSLRPMGYQGLPVQVTVPNPEPPGPTRFLKQLEGLDLMKTITSPKKIEMVWDKSTN